MMELEDFRKIVDNVPENFFDIYKINDKQIPYVKTEACRVYQLVTFGHYKFCYEVGWQGISPLDRAKMIAELFRFAGLKCKMSSRIKDMVGTAYYVEVCLKENKEL